VPSARRLLPLACVSLMCLGALLPACASGRPSCTASVRDGGDVLTVAVTADHPGDLVVEASAPWTAVREQDPGFPGHGTVALPAMGRVTAVHVGAARCRIGATSAPPPPAAEAGVAARLLVVGDSLTVQAAGDLTDRARARGVVSLVAAVSGSGLLTGYDWLPAARTLRRLFEPTVSVVEFVGNYPDPLPGIAGGSDAFVTAWSARAADLTSVLASGGGRVGWVLNPPMADAGLDAVARRLSDAYAALAARTPGVFTVDEHPAFCATTATSVRTPDGVHLSGPGCRLWSDVIDRRLEEVGAYRAT
jgi:hypothetical protein